MEDEGFYLLAEAIVVQACKDYKSAVRRKDIYQIKYLSAWFESEEFQFLSFGVDGEAILEKMNKDLCIECVEL